MACSPKNSVVQSPGLEVVRRFRVALAILLEAYDYAQDLRRSLWDFAVEIHTLRAAGLTNSDLRWLVCRGLIEHAAEITRPGQDSRVFHRTGTLAFTIRSCFILSEAGAVLARRSRDLAPPADEEPSPVTTTGSRQVPEWDKERQELRVGRLVVKQFKVPAPNQELVLAAFQEQGWPPRLDDPLPPRPDGNAKRRLRDTITTLNRHQKHRLIRFSGDGKGRGVRWELLAPQPDTDRWS